jgi:hypothetical protein
MFHHRVTLLVAFIAILPQPMSSLIYFRPHDMGRCLPSYSEAQLSRSQPPISNGQLVVLQAGRLRSEGSNKYGSGGGLIELKLGLKAAQLLSASSSERTRFAKELGVKCVLNHSL